MKDPCFAGLETNLFYMPRFHGHRSDIQTGHVKLVIDIGAVKLKYNPIIELNMDRCRGKGFPPVIQATDPF